MDITSSAQLEALLFVAGEPVSHERLMKQLGCDKATLSSAIHDLDQRLKAGQGGLALVQTDASVGLATAALASELVRSLRKQELEREIGQAGLEILAVLLYRGPSTRATIDHIRGVNSSSTVRALLSRGLIERVSEGREYCYRTSLELVAHLGLTAAQELPQYAELKSQIDTFEKKATQGEDQAIKDLEYEHADS
jgi:segregation and condensation protein B